MNIAIGADHRGFDHKEYIKEQIPLEHKNVFFHDVGAFNTERSDYPIFAQEVCEAMLAGQAQLGVLICGSGIGMAIMANRYPRIYAGLVWNVDVARMSREHDNTNVLVLPSDFISKDEAVNMVSVWLDAQFLGGRYQERLEMIDAL